MVKIKDIPLNDRPIERLINNGVENLSTEEILAIIIKTGSKKYSSKEIASQILSEIKEVNKLKNINLNTLLKIDGIGIKKASVLLASIELGKRINSVLDTLNDIKITNSLQVYNYYRNIIGDKEQEYFCCIYLDSNKKVLESKTLFIGTLNYSMVHPRDIFKEAYIVGAISIICVHNHPSGEIFPSKKDRELTNHLIQIGNIMGIKIDDHIIIGDNKYYSFFENNDI